MASNTAELFSNIHLTHICVFFSCRLLLRCGARGERKRRRGKFFFRRWVLHLWGGRRKTGQRASKIALLLVPPILFGKEAQEDEINIYCILNPGNKNAFGPTWLSEFPDWSLNWTSTTGLSKLSPLLRLDLRGCLCSWGLAFLPVTGLSLKRTLTEGLSPPPADFLLVLWLKMSDLRWLTLFLRPPAAAEAASFCWRAASLSAELRAITISLALGENSVNIPSARPQFLAMQKIRILGWVNSHTSHTPSVFFCHPKHIHTITAANTK